MGVVTALANLPVLNDFIISVTVGDGQETHRVTILILLPAKYIPHGRCNFST